MLKILRYSFFGAIGGLMIFAWFGCISNDRDKKMIEKGEKIIIKVEEYKYVHKKLPNSLSDLGLKELDGMDVIYYYKRDSIHYTVSFPISAEEHKFYYSDSKKWENGYRDMKWFFINDKTLKLKS